MSRNNLIALCLVAGVAVSLAGPTVRKREVSEENAPKQPKITYSKETVSKEGENVKLDCAVEGVDLSGIEEFKVTWSKIDVDKPTNSYPIAENNKILLFSNKFDIDHPDNSYMYSLTIKEFDEEDMGLYRCTVFFGDDQKINADVPVRIEKAPFFTDNFTKTLTVTEGDAISIDCQPGGSPKPDVYWERLNQELPYYGGKFFKANQFSIPLIERSHEGHYVCYADNGIGNPANSHVILEVEFAPLVTVGNTQVFASTSDSVQLTCNVEAHPSPDVVWYKDDVAILGGANRKISMEEIQEEGGNRIMEIKSALNIAEVTGEDFGTYTCKALNTVGKTEQNVELRMKSPPLIVSQSRSEVLYDLTRSNLRDALPVVVECEAEGQPEPSYRWTKNGEPLVWQANSRLSLEPFTGNLLISEPMLEDNGLYQCFAFNELGTALSDPVYVLNATSIKFSNVGDGQDIYNVEAELGRPFKLTCPNATAYPEPALNWVKAISMEDQIELKFINNERVVSDPYGNLWFTHVVPEDATTEQNFQYMCLGSTEFEPSDYSIASIIEMTVVPPSDGAHNGNQSHVNVETFEMYTSPLEVTFKAQEENTLWCIFGGEPVPNVSWRRLDQVEFDESRFATRNFGRTLVFKDTQLMDQGTYECRASNGVGEAKTSTITVTVEQAPTFVGDFASQTVREGSTVTFTCEAESTGEVTYTWMFNGRPINPEVTHPRRSVTTSKLTIQEVTLVDIGNYACNATSDLGYAYGQATLNVIPGENRPMGSGVSQAAMNDLRNEVTELRETVKEIHALVVQQLEVSKNNNMKLNEFGAILRSPVVVKQESQTDMTEKTEEEQMMQEADDEEDTTRSFFN